MEEKERVIAYIDGFNLYFGIVSAFKNVRWLNIELLVKNLLKPHQELIAVKYFTNFSDGRYFFTFPESQGVLPDSVNNFKDFITNAYGIQWLVFYKGYVASNIVNVLQGILA